VFETDRALPVIYFRDTEGHDNAVVLGKATPSYSDSFEGKRIWDGMNNIRNESIFIIEKLPCMFMKVATRSKNIFWLAF
jgi:hypothetical protein